MKYGKINLGQIESLINVLGGESVVESLLNGTSKFVIETVKRLTPLTNHPVAGNKSNPQEYFKTRNGLWVSDNFKNYILAAAEDNVVETNDSKIGYADLTETVNDDEIQGELPKGHVFEDVKVFLGHLASLINAQPEGKAGVLLNNCTTNIFYVKGVNDETFAVCVYWYSDDREWSCHADRLGGRQWSARNRAFSATDA